MSRIDGTLVRFESGGNPLPFLASMGTLSGVRITAVAGLNGRGNGALAIDASNNLSWRAPHSNAFGDPQDVSAGGSFYLADGDDPDKWVKVGVTSARLPGGLSAAAVALDWLLHNSIGHAEVTLLPDDDSWTVSLKNTSGSTITSLVFWLDLDEPANRDLTLDWGVNTGVQDFTQTQALLRTTVSLAHNASTTLTIRRQLGGSAAASPARLLRLYAGWDDTVGGRGRAAAGGLYRIRGTAAYRVYESEGEDPAPGVDTPLASNGALPFTPSDTFTDGDYRFALTRVNQYGLESGSHHLERITLSGGTQTGNAPTPPYSLLLTQLAGRIPRVQAQYLPPPDSEREADEWALWYTTDGSAPDDSDPPDYNRAVSLTPRGAWLVYDLPAQVDATVVRVLVKMLKNDVQSDTGLSATLTVDGVGPAAPVAGTAWRGLVEAN